jgi:hypothetical protein
MTRIDEAAASSAPEAEAAPTDKPRRVRRSANSTARPEVDGLPPEEGAARSRRSPRKAAETAPAEATTEPAGRAPSKLEALLALLAREGGASLAEMIAATGWQGHSVRGALAGAIRKRGHEVISGKGEDGVRRYRTGAGA